MIHTISILSNRTSLNFHPTIVEELHCESWFHLLYYIKKKYTYISFMFSILIFYTNSIQITGFIKGFCIDQKFLNIFTI